MKKIFVLLSIASMPFTAFASPAEVSSLIEKISLQQDHYVNLNYNDQREVRQKLDTVLRLLEGRSAEDAVICAKDDSTDYILKNLSKGINLGTDKRGSEWCEKALSLRPAGIVCAPDDMTDFAIFRISDGKQIGEDIRGNQWCSKDIVNVRYNLVCAPDDMTDFAVYDIATGLRLGSDMKGSDWCAQSMQTATDGLICIPEGPYEFMIFDLNTRKTVSTDYKTIGSCVAELPQRSRRSR